MKSGKPCPICGHELEYKESCCDDKKKGWTLLLKCDKCGYKRPVG